MPKKSISKPKRSYRRKPRAGDNISVGRLRGPFKSFVQGDPFPPTKLYKLRFTDGRQMTAGSGGIAGT